MKQTIYLVFALVAVLGMFSCADDTIGMSVTDTKSAIIEDSSFVIYGKSVANDSLQSRTSAQLVGLIKSNGFGTLSSEVVTQYMPVYAVDTAGVKEEWVDSCKLVLTVPEVYGFTGDSIAPMRMSVYKLNKQLPDPIYSKFDPKDYYNEEDLLGTAPYSLASSKLVSETNTSTYTTTTHREIEVPMPVSLARSIFREYINNDETFKSPKAFANFFPGVYIKNTFGSGRVMNFTNSALKVYYRKTVVNGSDNDTVISGVPQTYMASSPEVISNNIIKLDIDASIKQMVANGDAIVMAPSGYEVEVQFPIQEIINSYKNRTTQGLSVINNLELEIPVEEIKTQYDIAPPKYLLMVKTNHKNDFIAGDSLTNSKDSFYAIYDASKKTYDFSQLRDYIINIIENQGGVATEDDKQFTITPMDVTTYTTAASYYTASTTTVTKIAPQVSVPAIAKLRLDKAKVKITYSTQTNM